MEPLDCCRRTSNTAVRVCLSSIGVAPATLCSIGGVQWVPHHPPLSLSLCPPISTAELDSLLTVRTQTQSVLSVTIFSAENYPNNGPQRAGAFAAAGRDGSIGLYNLPVAESERGEPFSYEDYQGFKAHIVSRAHDDAIWDLHAHPLSNVLFSAGADGVVRAWGVSSGAHSRCRCGGVVHACLTGLWCRDGGYGVLLMRQS